MRLSGFRGPSTSADIGIPLTVHEPSDLRLSGPLYQEGEKTFILVACGSGIRVGAFIVPHIPNRQGLTEQVHSGSVRRLVLSRQYHHIGDSVAL